MIHPGIGDSAVTPHTPYASTRPLGVPMTYVSRFASFLRSRSLLSHLLTLRLRLRLAFIVTATGYRLASPDSLSESITQTKIAYIWCVKAVVESYFMIARFPPRRRPSRIQETSFHAPLFLTQGSKLCSVDPD